MSELLLIVTIAGERVAISSTCVDSVVEIETIKPVPRAVDHVLGLAALRSRVFTVIDSLAALGLGGSCPGKRSDAVIVEAEGHLYALLVDSVEDAFESEGETAPVTVPLSPAWQRAARGMVEAGDDILLLIDAQALIAGPTALEA
jgi:purine-binding chemotaxis protein CheW